MDKEQILALAEEQGAVANLKQHFNVAGDSIVFTPEELEAFFNAAIESYKAELLKEVGVPVNFCSQYSLDRVAEYNNALVRIDSTFHEQSPVAIYTSDQVAAAIINATKQLEGEIERLKSEQTELIDRFQNENCGRVHMGEPVISQSIKETVRQWLDIRANENVAIDIDELVKIAQGNLQQEAAQYKDELAMVLRCSADLRSQLAAAQEEIERPPAIDAYETYMADDKESDPVERLRFFLSLALKGKDWLDVERFIKDVSDQLAKAEQLWQIAQGRCDGLEEKLAKAEQRVAEACALQVATEIKFHWLDAARVAKEIRSGEWRKFLKEGE